MSGLTLHGRPPALKAEASDTARALRSPSGSPRISLLVRLDISTTPGDATVQAA